MVPPFATWSWPLLALFVGVVVAAPQSEGCDCNSTCAEMVARQRKEIARLEAEVRSLRRSMDTTARRAQAPLSSCDRDWEVTTDAEVEAFRLEGCRAVKSLTIGGTLPHSSITSLAGLSSLETAENVWISLLELTSLVGLDNLRRVEELLEVFSNGKLESMAGLQSLETVGEFIICDNRQLQSLTGLEHLARVEELLAVSENNKLRSLAGLQGLQTVGEVFIRDNQKLQSLTGLESLARVRERLEIRKNSKLKSIAALRSLEAVDVLWIQKNPELQSLTGLENLKHVEHVTIQQNDRLRSIAGLQGLEIAGEVDIDGNSELQTLSGLENLVRVEESLNIDDNPKLRSLALHALESANTIWLSSNPLLDSLTGLESLTHVGRLILHDLGELRSLAALRSLTNVWSEGMTINKCHKLTSLEGLGTLSLSQLRVDESGPLEYLGGPLATGSSVRVLRIDDGSWPPCVTQHERVSLLSVVEDKYASFIPNATWHPGCGTKFMTFSCTKGQPCSVSLTGEESKYTRVFVSARFTGCGACSDNRPQGDVAKGGTVDLGYALRDEEAGLHSICRCAGGIGPVAQLLLRGPRKVVAEPCVRGSNCTFELEGEALERTDRVVLVRGSCSENPSLGFVANWTADNVPLLHDPATWYAAPATTYQVCWRAPCTTAPDGPTCPAPEDSYIHVGEVELLGPYRRSYAPVLGAEIPFSVSNIGLGVSDGDLMRLRRACGEADEEGIEVLAANSSGMVFDFGRLTGDRVQAGSHRLCWCRESSGAKCNASWHFRADAGVVDIWCPAGQELVDSRRCESCPAGKQQPKPGLHPCSACLIGQFSRGANELCEGCPGGKVAGLKGSSACVACRAWQSADPEAAGCSPNPVMLVLLALFHLSVGVFFAILVHGMRRRLSVVDVSQEQTAGTTTTGTDITTSTGTIVTCSSHGLRNVGRTSFPVKLHGTGHPDLDSPAEPFRARVKDAMRLELLTSTGQPINRRLDTSMGTLAVAFPHDLSHQRLVVVGLPVLFTVSAAFGALVVSADLITEALLGAAAVALTSSAAVAALRLRPPRATPLQTRLSEFELKLGQELRGSSCSVEKGPRRAIAIGRLHELLDFFRDFIRDRTAYFLDSNILQQLTKAKRISYAELVGAGQVEWFVSHFWGTPFAHFCTALRKHAEMVCGLRDWTTLHYWVCFCSNNQYEIQEELGGEAGWEESSFYLTLKSGRCRGTCMVLDDKALPLTRIWCIFELLQTVKLERSDAAFQGLLLCTSGGVLNTGGGSAEVAMALAEKVAGMNLQTAQATSEKDASMIREQVITEMGSFTALNRFICHQMRGTLARAQQHTNKNFVAVFAQLDQAIIANAHENEDTLDTLAV